MCSRVVLIGLVVASSFPTVPIRAEASDTVTRWDNFSESSTCGRPYTRTPYVSRSGWLSDSERILGPFGTYFGRSIAEVRSSLVWWTVPGSGGRRVQVNRAMLDDLRQVADALSAEAARGRVYAVTSVSAFTPRTIGGAHQLSRHALGLALDINPAQNPYRSDNRLITNMPSWFVDAWRDAGFCWGGDWRYAKDPMHFSWIGSGSDASQSTGLSPRPPKTSTKPFGGRDATHATEFARVTDRYLLAVADGTGNGAPDAIGLRPHPDGAVIDIASSTYAYGECSIFRWFVDDDSVANAEHVLFGDFDGDSGQDLIALEAAGPIFEAAKATRSAEFEDLARTPTGAATSSVVFASADFDGDGIADLWEGTSDGRLRVWKGPGFSQLISDALLPAGAPDDISAGDIDGGDAPELFALYGEGGSARIDVLRWGSLWVLHDSISLSSGVEDIPAVGAGDYDGDGRSDVQILSRSGDLDVYVGNTSTGSTLAGWFLRPDFDCNDEEDSILETNIESIARAGVTKGCNPPFNDRFCPKASVSRETMAAFLVRALGLTDDSHPGFKDVVPGSTFAQDIEKLASAGITKGCNPPVNDMFCPKDPVTRETMAAFLVRALQLTQNTHAGFVDVFPGSVFASDIGRLATAGITKGCNPPLNDMFCPKDVVTRETMAAFLDRAGLGD